ncbi:hypothetical protein GCM10011376_39340 [Nocardioides flavus (ex Wang et al. 2016)]|uniref:Uncharacterized protein n=1 Tax=Nocardioides flavus (ex Wang et al. 2016) TaxID=2058780 RepID=A0ABQ3HSY8_9ACTN|nr:hypothetical protein GCM10011376_39340 [Nocardioides flavus (ex Wang et al. 2016)]
MLEVVEDEEAVLAAQPVDHVVEDRPRRVASGIHGIGDRWQDLGGLEERREPDEGDPVGEAVPHVRRHSQCQPRLAHPAGAAEGDEATGAEQVRHPRDVVVAAHQRRRRDGQVAVPYGRRRGRLPGRAGRDGGDEAGALVRAEVEGGRERAERVRVGTGAGAALQGTDRVRAQAGPLGQLLLGEPRVLAQRAQQGTERVTPTRPHVTSAAARPSCVPRVGRECSDGPGPAVGPERVVPGEVEHLATLANFPNADLV